MKKTTKKYHLSPRYRYNQQKKGAAKRGIVWEFTFNEWISLWIKSGHYDDMGTKRGQYCMARNNDSGPYSVANVRITTTEDNHREAVKQTRKHTSIENQTCQFGPRVPWNKGLKYSATESQQHHLRKLHKSLKKSVITPTGEFDSINEAAIAHGIHKETARRWCHNEKHGWKFNSH